MRRNEVGFVFQAYHLMDELTAQENVELPALLAGRSPQDARRRAAHLLEQVGLADRAEHLPSALSGGQRQRVAIARALANQPQFVLADEPTGNLDSAATLEVLRLFESLHAAGLTLVIATHDERIAATADRLISMRDGAFVDQTRLVGGTRGRSRRDRRSGRLIAMGRLLLVCRLGGQGPPPPAGPGAPSSARYRRRGSDADPRPGASRNGGQPVREDPRRDERPGRGRDRPHRRLRPPGRPPSQSRATRGPRQAEAAPLLPLRHAAGVAASSGPFPVTWTVLRTGQTVGSAEVEGRDSTPSPVDQPTLLHGSWVAPGGVVVEAGFAGSLGIGVGDRLDLGGTTVDVVGIAVTAAIPAYPNTCGGGRGVLPGQRGGRAQPRPGVGHPSRCREHRRDRRPRGLLLEPEARRSGERGEVRRRLQREHITDGPVPAHLAADPRR